MHQTSEESEILCELIIRGKETGAVEGTSHIVVEAQILW
jgi:hypothetical protein